jgi:molybdopterin-synthase adenylyltransferase
MTEREEVNSDDDRDDRADRPRVGLREGQLSPTERVTRYRMRPSVEPFLAASTGDLYLLRPGESEDLVVRGADAVDRALVEALRGSGKELHELRAAVGCDDLAARLRALDAAGVLIEEHGAPARLPGQLAERFDRQLPYFGETGDAAEAQLRLRAATVVVLGCGGLGTWALAGLATAGVGRFVLVDHDTIETSNLNRQILYGPDDVGAPKAERAAAWLRRFDPDVDVRALRGQVSGPDDLVPLLRGADVLVQTADWPPHAIVRWADEACRSSGVPYLIGGQRPPVLRIGPTFVPGETACFACHELALRRAFPLYEELTRARDAEPARAITLGPASGIAGTLIALEVMHLLVGRPPATAGRALLLDMRTLETRWEAVERLDDCPACHHPGG